MKQFFKRIWPSKRKLMQLYFALLFNANLKGFTTGNIYRGKTKALCVPGLNCYSCPGAVGACPLGSLQGAFSAGHSTLFYVCGILLLYGVLLGRTVCGWLCPFGLVQELLYKIRTPKIKKSPVTRILSYLKYVLLAVFVFLVPLLYALKDVPLPAFCKYICPAGTLEGGLLLLSHKVNESYFSMLGPLFTWKFLLLVSVAVASVFVFRLFCRFLCPLGALYGLFNRISLFGVRMDGSKCAACGRCTSHCKVDIRRVGDSECVACGECISLCPTEAITWKGTSRLWQNGKATGAKEAPHAGRRLVTRLLVAAVMLSVLIGAIFHYGNQDDAPLPESGYEIGDAAIGASLAVTDGTGLTGTTVDPAKTGTVTVINFWGIWCTPCIEELPHFDRIAREFPEAVTVIAVHTHSGFDRAPGYITEYYPKSAILFAKDEPMDDTGLSGAYYTALGGRGMFPYTVILDGDGIIRAKFTSTLTYEELLEAVLTLLGE